MYGAGMARFAVVGSGAWGTALAAHIARLEHEVVMWAFEPEVAGEIGTRHTNETFLPGVPLPATIRASHEVAAVVEGADVVVLVPPSSHLRRVSAAVAPALSPDAIVVVATKGIEEGSLKLMSEVLRETMPAVEPSRLAFLSGPTFAREVARGLPTDVAVACTDMATATRVQGLLHSVAMRVYTTTDPIGVQVGGAIKNVMAVAIGACDGLGMGLNARAALITRGLAEITRLGVAMGAHPLTCIGMSGVGDLVLTCTGTLSRNRRVGQALGAGRSLAEATSETRMVAEGVRTTLAACALAERAGVEMPIAMQMREVLYRGRPPREAVEALMLRMLKRE